MNPGIDLRSVESISNVEQLEDLLSAPTPGVIEALGRLDGDILILGVGGKMGPSLARMARRALDLAGSRREVIGVARFSEPGLEASLQESGIRTIRADLLDPSQLAKLPDAPLIVYMAGMKFGSTGQEPKTWAVNALAPGLVGLRYPKSRIVAFSTGNVYGLTAVDRGGSRENDTPQPCGEYAMSCLGRERILQAISQDQGSPMVLLRLNYAVETRYGVLVDLARKVQAREPIDLTIGAVNLIWQGDANAQALQALEHAESPPLILNLTGPEQLSVRQLAERFGEILGVPPVLQGAEAPEALLSDASRARSLFGPPRVEVDRLIAWVADWVGNGRPLLDKPTKFEVADGKF